MNEISMCYIDEYINFTLMYDDNDNEKRFCFCNKIIHTIFCFLFVDNSICKTEITNFKVTMQWHLQLILIPKLHYIDGT